MNCDDLLIRSVTTEGGADREELGWNRVGFRVDAVNDGEVLQRHSGDSECALVPLSGVVIVECNGDRWTVGGRKNVFDGPPEALYLSRDSSYSVRAVGPVEIATCSARAEQRRRPQKITSADYSIELRGAGGASRQVVTVIPPGFPADRLLVVEVWTPGGNWSSYPPHKHDVPRPPLEVALEEVYYYRLRPAHGFALQRLYSPERGVDRTWKVGNDDLFAIPWGFHTTVAAPGCDLYYLNVLAGDAHALTAFEDPELSAVKAEWPTLAIDPRLPLFTS